VEPVLQVLVGKTLEQSRIELIEDYEIDEEIKHRVLIINLSESDCVPIGAVRKAEERRVDGHAEEGSRETEEGG